MAISKKRVVLTKDGAPDPAAFTRLIDEALAEPLVVAHAYMEAYGRWVAAGGDTSVDVVDQRTERDPGSPGSRLIHILRAEIFNSQPTHKEVQ